MIELDQYYPRTNAPIAPPMKRQTFLFGFDPDAALCVSIIVALSPVLQSCSRDGNPAPKDSDRHSKKTEPPGSEMDFDLNFNDGTTLRTEPEKPPVRSGKSILADDLRIAAMNPTTYEGINERVNAIKRIGEGKHVEAIPFLVGKLIEIRSFDSGGVSDFSASYPCASALVNIGPESVPPLQEHFLKSSSEMEQLVIVATLARIQGSKDTASWIAILMENGALNLNRDRMAELKEFVLSLNIESQF